MSQAVVPFQFGEHIINIAGIIPDNIIGVFSPQELLAIIQGLHEDFEVQIHGDDAVIILVRPEVIV